MKDLLYKNLWTKEELKKMDIYFFEDHIEELASMDNETIIRFIDACDEIIGHSIAELALGNHLADEALDAKIAINPDKLDYYDKILELIERYDSYEPGLAYTIGNYFHNKDKEKALKYFGKAFKKGFDLSDSGYYYPLSNYISLLDNNPCDVLKDLISSSPRDGEYSLDFINTYLLLIVNLEKYSDEYLHYINEAILITLPIVRSYQEKHKNRRFFSDTDEERNLCELIALKMEYYLYKKDYQNTFKYYIELTEEIGRSDCTRYYHARDKFYREMLEGMSKEYPELKFFDDIGFMKFKLKDNNLKHNINEFSENQIIRLERTNGLEFDFKIVDIDRHYFVVVPLLPLLGDGGKMFFEFEDIEGIKYFTNRLSH